WGNHLMLVRDAEGKEPPLTTEGQFRRGIFGGPRKRNAPYKVAAGAEDRAYDLTKYYDLTKPGRYTVQYVYEEKDAGVPPREGWTGRLPSNEAAFAVVARKEQTMAKSEAVRVEGLSFVAFAPKSIAAPPVGESRFFDLGLRVTDVSGKPL